MDRKYLRYIFIAGVVVGAVIAAALLMRPSAESNSSESAQKDMIGMFYEALCGGRFDEAAGYCTGEQMQDYIESYRKVLERMQAKDSSATAIATDLLSDIRTETTEKVTDKGVRTLFYTIEDGLGHSRNKIAILKKEEGEWRIEQIQDRD